MRAVDFEQPRALWQKVFDDGAKERFVGNVAGHIKGVKSKVVLERQRKLKVFYIKFSLLILYRQSVRLCRS